MRTIACAVLLLLAACSLASDVWPSAAAARPDAAKSASASRGQARDVRLKDFDIAYEYVSRESVLNDAEMRFYHEDKNLAAKGCRSFQGNSLDASLSLQRCDFGDILCVIDPGITKIPIVISSDFATSKRLLARAGFDLFETGHLGDCRGYDIIKRRPAADPPSLRYAFCPDVGVTEIAWGSREAPGGFYELRSARGLGAEVIDKFDFGSKKNHQVDPRAASLDEAAWDMARQIKKRMEENP